MTFVEILLIAALILIIINIILTFSKRSATTGDFRSELIKMNADLERIDPLIRGEFSNNRDELQRGSKDTREELSNSFKNFGETLTKNIKDNRTELTNSLKSFEEKFSANVKEFNELQRQKFNDLAIKNEQLRNETENKLEKIREIVENLKSYVVGSLMES